MDSHPARVAPLAPSKKALHVHLDEPGRPDDLARCRGMSYGFVGVLMCFVPRCRGAVQIGCSLATLVL